MHSLISIVLASFVPLGAAFTTPANITDSTCSANQPSEALLAAHREMAALEKNHLLRRNEINDTHPAIDIDVYVHVISTSETASNHHDNDTIHSQIAALNAYFNPGNISFVLKNASWTVSPYYSTAKDNIRTRILHHKGDNRHLNIYYVKYPLGGTNNASVAAFPNELQDSLGFEKDGVMIAAYWLFGDQKQTTVVHEVGHWFGLLHTFEGGCDGDNDMIDDTPAHARGSYGCSKMPPLDTCPEKPGSDPVHNPMNYLPDSCVDKFTDQQFERMRSLWTKYRSQPLQRPTLPTELEPIEPVNRGGSLPFYPAANPALAYLRCFPDENGTVEEVREEYCGTDVFCDATHRAEKKVSVMRYARKYNDCLKERTPPKSEN